MLHLFRPAESIQRGDSYTSGFQHFAWQTNLTRHQGIAYGTPACMLTSILVTDAGRNSPVRGCIRRTHIPKSVTSEYHRSCRSCPPLPPSSGPSDESSTRPLVKWPRQLRYFPCHPSVFANIGMHTVESMLRVLTIPSFSIGRRCRLRPPTVLGCHTYRSPGGGGGIVLHWQFFDALYTDLGFSASILSKSPQNLEKRVYATWDTFNPYWRGLCRRRDAIAKVASTFQSPSNQGLRLAWEVLRRQVMKVFSHDFWAYTISRLQRN